MARKTDAKTRNAAGKTARKGAKSPRVNHSNKGEAAGASQITNGGQLGANMIRVRMYRVGFGDCFLVSLPMAKGSHSADRHLHLLIDCGVHGSGDIGTMARIVDQIAIDTDKKLAAIIATHGHQDHISGFDNFGNKFSSFEIGEIWLPWTWDPNNKRAVRLQKNHLALTTQLTDHYAALAATEPQAVSAAAANAIENLKGNAHAMALLKSGFGVTSKIRYLKAGDNLPNSEHPDKNSTSLIPGLSVRVLGPPDSEEFLAQMDPPKDQKYLRLGLNNSPEVANAIQPFTPKWRLDDAQEEYPNRLPVEEEQQIQDTSSSPLDNLAFALDRAKNNESLVTLLIFRGQYLLFPGDAQYGNWRWWLENEQSEEILPRITFFKVAHHASKNATPVKALEAMNDGEFAAMVSTQSTPWASIPRVPLMARLSDKTRSRIVRSDWLPIDGAPLPLPETAPPMPSRLPAGFSRGTLWFDYLIEV